MQGTLGGLLGRTTALMSMLVLALAGSSYAQAGGHAHSSPHGGEVVVVANHHVEFKADSTGTIYVWLLDANLKTVAPPSGASVTLMGGGGTQVTLPFQVDARPQRLAARFDRRRFTSFQAVVRIPIAGTPHNLRFRYPSHH